MPTSPPAGAGGPPPPGMSPKVGSQMPPPPAGGLQGLPPGVGPKPPMPGGLGMTPMAVHGHAAPGAMAHQGEAITVTIPRMAFENLTNNLKMLLNVLVLGGQKADADVAAQSHGIAPGAPAGPTAPGASGPGMQNPNIQALAQKLGLGGP
jgi:hypothetical protein